LSGLALSPAAFSSTAGAGVTTGAATASSTGAEPKEN